MAWENIALFLIQAYWVIWLVGSFIVSIILGGVIFRNYEAVR